MTRNFAMIGAFAALLMPAGAIALGLGEIRLNSALNQPLDAEIELISPTGAELSVLKAEVAARETFTRYGLDRPEFLSTLRFSVGRSANGAPVLQVRSTRPIPEPFVTFLVEADWEKGRLLREYTVLLDPPAFLPVPEQQAAPVVSAPRPSTSPTRPLEGSVVRRDTSRSTASDPAPLTSRTRPLSADGVYGPVRRNETLWAIASRYRDNSVSMNQMMLAIFEANPEAFDNNINHLKRGASLRIPDVAAARSINRGQAFATAKQHNEAWQTRSPVRAASSAGPGASRPSATSQGSQSGRLELVSPDVSAADLTAANAALQETRNALAQQQTRADSAEQALTTTRTDLEEARRLIEVRDTRLAEMQSRLARAEQSGTAAQSPAAAQTPGATDVGVELTPAPAVTPPTTPVAGSEKPPVTITPPPATADPKPAVTAPSQSDSLLNKVGATIGSLWPLLLGLLALIGAGLAFLFVKRRQIQPESWEAPGDTVADALGEDAAGKTVLHTRTDTEPAFAAGGEESVEYFDDTGTFKPVDFMPSDDDELPGAPVAAPPTGTTGEYPFEDTMSGEAALKLDQSDPLAEADFHMAYGLYDQAAELVSKAADREPDRRDLHLKLLEIYFVWGNKEEFVASAQRLRDSQEHAPPGEWDKILIMGKQICPEEALFSGEAGASAGEVDLELAGGGMETLDFETGDEGSSVDLDLGEALGAAPDAASDLGDGLDLDFGSVTSTGTGENTVDVGAVREKIAASALDAEVTAEMDVDSLGLDLDIGDSTPASDTPAADDSSGEFGVGTNIFGDFDILGATSSNVKLDEDSALGQDTAEVRAGAETAEVEIEESDFDLDFGDLDFDADSDNATERNQVTAADDGEEHFSAEIKTLSDDAVDLDFGDLSDTTGGHTVSSRVLPSDFVPGDEGLSDEDTIGPDDETVQTPAATMDEGDDFANVFGMGDETVKADISDLNLDGGDDDFAAIFGNNDATVQADLSDMRLDHEGRNAGGDDETVKADVSELDIDLGDAFSETSTDEDATRELEAGGEEMGIIDLDVGDSHTGPDDAPTTMTVPAAELALPMSGGNNELNEVGTKLDLARAYVDMGDPDGARGILGEVIEEGDEKQKRDARELLDSLA